MMNPLLTNHYEEEILQLIDHRDAYTRGDLQSVVTSIVNRLLVDGYRLVREQNENNDQFTKQERDVVLTALTIHRVKLEAMRAPENHPDEPEVLDRYLKITRTLLKKIGKGA